jgi:membrane protein YdbS with pleckstrin-like domain
MRLISPGQMGPAAVSKYLLPYEERVVTVRKHPAILAGPIAVTLAGLVIALLLATTILAGNATADKILLVGCLLLILRLGLSAFHWWEGYFVVTSQRMLQVEGIITRKVLMMPLVKVTDMTFERSFLGRVLGYGKFILESAGQDQALSSIDHVPYPEQLYLEICRLIFPGKEDEGDD